MPIRGIEGLSDEQIHAELQLGAKFVIFSYTISVLVLTFRRSSDVFYIRPGESTFRKSLPYTLISLFLGWWGFPWGFIYTPTSLATNLSGGKNVTHDILATLVDASTANENGP